MASTIRRAPSRPAVPGEAVYSALRHHPDAAWLYEPDLGRLLYANPAACHLFGPLSDLQRRPPLFQFAVEDRERLVGLLGPATRRREALRLTAMELVQDEGQRIPVEVVCSFLDGDDGLVLWCRDSSDRVLESRDQAGRLRLEREARSRAEADRERLEFFSLAGRQLAASLDYPSTLACVARLAVPRLANWCILDLTMDDDSLRREAVAHQEADKVLLACELQQHGPPRLGTSSLLWTVLASGRPLFGRLEAGQAPPFAHDARAAKLVTDLGIRSYLAVPLQARGRIFGCLTLVTAERDYQARDLDMAEGLARQAALAVDNASLYRECSAMAETLERSLMLPQLPRLGGMELAVHYQPAHGDTSVGGDFYDVCETTEGRWAVAVGDIRGKGLTAATLTTLARYTLRAAAMQGKAPAQALSLLNQALVRQETNRRTCTGIYAVLTLEAGRAQVRLGIAGHPLPFILRADGRVESGGRPGRLMGLYPHLELTEDDVHLGPGDSILLYTDGITDARLNGESFEDELPGLLSRCVGLDAQGIVALIEREIVDWQDVPSDDRAVLVLRVKPG